MLTDKEFYCEKFCTAKVDCISQASRVKSYPVRGFIADSKVFGDESFIVGIQPCLNFLLSSFEKIETRRFIISDPG